MIIPNENSIETQYRVPNERLFITSKGVQEVIIDLFAME